MVPTMCACWIPNWSCAPTQTLQPKRILAPLLASKRTRRLDLLAFQCTGLLISMKRKRSSSALQEEIRLVTRTQRLCGRYSTHLKSLNALNRAGSSHSIQIPRRKHQLFTRCRSVMSKNMFDQCAPKIRGRFIANAGGFTEKRDRLCFRVCDRCRVFWRHRVFVWISPEYLPSDATVAFARDDDYFFGVLHSRFHEVWALKLGTRLETRPRYTPTTCFETFPLPEPNEQQKINISAAAKELNELRENWLNPPEWTITRVLEFPGSSDGPWSRFIIDANARGIGTVRYPRAE